jgi:phosphatidylglycerophosphate synthase
MTTVSLSPAVLRGRFTRGSGGLWTRAVNRWGGSYLAFLAIAAGISPNQLSVLSASFGLATSAAVLLTFGFSHYLSAAIALVGWQTSHCVDCADGQVARATGCASDAGGQFDLLSDFVTHLSVVAVICAIVAENFEGRLATFVLVVAGGCWIVPLYHGALSRQSGKSSIPASESRPLVRLAVSTSRDYGLHVCLLSMALALGWIALLAVLGSVATLHALFLIKRSWTLWHTPNETARAGSIEFG